MKKSFTKILLICLPFLYQIAAHAEVDTTASKSKVTRDLPGVTVAAVRSLKGMGYLDEVSNGVIYSGKKTEVLVLDSIDANTAQNNPRQVMGRIPGAVFSET